MSRRKRREEELVLDMRAAATSDEDSTPTRIPDSFDARLTYESASLSDQILSEVADFMRKRGTSQQDLARSLGVSEGRVSQIMSGNQNLTIKTLASLAAAVQGHFQVTLVSTAGVDPWEPTDGSDPGVELPLPTPHSESPVPQRSEPLVPAGHRH